MGNKRDAIRFQHQNSGPGKILLSSAASGRGSGPAAAAAMLARRWPISPVPVRTTSAPESCRQNRIAASCRLPTPWAASSAVSSARLAPESSQQGFGAGFAAKRAKGVHRHDARPMLFRLGSDPAARPVDEIEPDHDRVESAARDGIGEHLVSWIAPKRLQ